MKHGNKTIRMLVLFMTMIRNKHRELVFREWNG